LNWNIFEIDRNNNNNNNNNDNDNDNNDDNNDNDNNDNDDNDNNDNNNNNSVLRPRSRNFSVEFTITELLYPVLSFPYHVFEKSLKKEK